MVGVPKRQVGVRSSVPAAGEMGGGWLCEIKGRREIGPSVQQVVRDALFNAKVDHLHTRVEHMDVQQGVGVRGVRSDVRRELSAGEEAANYSPACRLRSRAMQDR